LQVLLEIGAAGRIDVHHRVHLRVHVLLHQAGVEMSRVERHQPHAVGGGQGRELHGQECYASRNGEVLSFHK
jgi:hypothetical protein